jgi:hypothetical protein
MIQHRPKIPQRALALALAALCFAIYAQVRHHEFVDYDDYVTILHYDALEVSSISQAVQVAVTPYHANWIPLTTLSLALDRRLYGEQPRGYLLTNVALHALATAVLFLALAAMTGATWRSAFVAAVFAAHPLHVESVAWANERKDVLCGVFWMLALAAQRGATAFGPALRHGPRVRDPRAARQADGGDAAVRAAAARLLAAAPALAARRAREAADVRRGARDCRRCRGDADPQ